MVFFIHRQHGLSPMYAALRQLQDSSPNDLVLWAPSVQQMVLASWPLSLHGGDYILDTGLREWLRARGLHISCFCVIRLKRPTSCRIIHEMGGDVVAKCHFKDPECPFFLRLSVIRRRTMYAEAFRNLPTLASQQAPDIERTLAVFQQTPRVGPEDTIPWFEGYIGEYTPEREFQRAGTPVLPTGQPNSSYLSGFFGPRPTFGPPRPTLPKSVSAPLSKALNRLDPSHQTAAHRPRGLLTAPPTRRTDVFGRKDEDASKRKDIPGLTSATPVRPSAPSALPTPSKRKEVSGPTSPTPVRPSIKKQKTKTDPEPQVLFKEVIELFDVDEKPFSKGKGKGKGKGAGGKGKGKEVAVEYILVSDDEKLPSVPPPPPRPTVAATPSSSQNAEAGPSSRVTAQERFLLECLLAGESLSANDAAGLFEICPHCSAMFTSHSMKSHVPCPHMSLD
ncbi:hypothetical protein DFP72DRAFT_1127746 [Ephemerocybe angulata]|uniref:Uncharacterized protein n=1 Tax=Ephemerocybe angulata TaxID=980116 RepID=A0A8H6LTU7_9AGAR|nr:hypothetical protein DFP72DRAFT_1127746 [Tulosesus angulatus]